MPLLEPVTRVTAMMTSSSSPWGRARSNGAAARAWGDGLAFDLGDPADLADLTAEAEARVGGQAPIRAEAGLGIVDEIERIRRGLLGALCRTMFRWSGERPPHPVE